MLEKIDLGKKLEKAEFKQILPELKERLYAVQKASWDAQIPVILLFEGWDAAGKGTSIQSLTGPIDPRGFKLYPIRAARTYEKKRPWLWRFWTKIPARGEWAIFDRSWYGRVLVERVEKLIPEAEWRRGYRDILDFERTLADDGALILKFFLHISKQEQKKRFEKLLQDPLTAWHVTPEDWDHHRHYDEWYQAYEEMLERTDTEWGTWTIVEATNKRYTQVKIFKTIIKALEEKLGIQDSVSSIQYPESSIQYPVFSEQSPVIRDQVAVTGDQGLGTEEVTDQAPAAGDILKVIARLEEMEGVDISDVASGEKLEISSAVSEQLASISQDWEPEKDSDEPETSPAGGENA